MMKPKALDFKTLAKLEDVQYPVGELKLDMGEQSFVVKYQERFKTASIQALVQEMMEVHQAINENTEININDLVFILLIKHFTDIPFDAVDTVEEKIEMYIRTTNLLNNLETVEGISCFQAIFRVFNDKEIEKVSSFINEITNTIHKLELGEVDGK